MAEGEKSFQESRQIRWYQWEFLRRNPEYRRDYDEFMAKFGAWFQKRGFWYQLQRGRATYTDRDLLFYYNNIWPVLREICAKWRIRDPFSPEWKFDESGSYEYAPRRRVSLPTGYTSEQAAPLWDSAPVELVCGSRRGTIAERFKLKRELREKTPRKKSAPQDPRLLPLRIDVTRSQRELIQPNRKQTGLGAKSGLRARAVGSLSNR